MGIEWHTLRIRNVTDWQYIANHAGDVPPQHASDSPLESLEHVRNPSPECANDSSCRRANDLSFHCMNDLSPSMLEHPNDPSPWPTTSLLFHHADIAADTAQPWDAGMDDSHVGDAQETLPAFQERLSQSCSVAVSMTDNPYGFDLAIAAAYVDDDDEGHQRELDDEFAPGCRVCTGRCCQFWCPLRTATLFDANMVEE